MIVSMSHDQIIGEPDESGLPSVTIFGGWKGRGHGRFQPVEGHMHEERGPHSPWRGTGCRGKECVSVHHAGLEPGGHRPSQGREGVECGDQGLVIDPVEAFFAVGLSDVLVLLVHACRDRFDRIVTGTSWTEAVAIGLELRLPCRFQGAFRQGLSGAIRHDGNPSWPVVRRARFGNPDPAYRLDLRRQGQCLSEA